MKTPFSQHLMIDGYNIIHAWEKTAKSLRRSIEQAREDIADHVRAIHDVECIRTTIVFDGQGNKINLVRPTKEVTFSYIFSPKDMSADGVIEQLAYKDKKPGLITVATGDFALQTLVTNIGCNVLTPQGLLNWVERCRNQQSRFIKQHKSKTKNQWKNMGPWDQLGK